MESQLRLRILRSPSSTDSASSSARPVGGSDPLALCLGQLRQGVALAMHRAALTIGLGQQLLRSADQARRAVGDDEQRAGATGERLSANVISAISDKGHL